MIRSTRQAGLTIAFIGGLIGLCLGLQLATWVNRNMAPGTWNDLSKLMVGIAPIMVGFIGAWIIFWAVINSRSVNKD